MVAGQPLAQGKHNITYDFNASAGDGGTMVILVDGSEVARGEITKRPRMLAGNGETLDTGRDTNVSVSPDYRHEGVFNGVINRIEVKPKMPSRGAAH